MRRFLAVCSAALCLAVSAPVFAIPEGTYMKSCKDIKSKDPDDDSARIQAKCQDSTGEWRKTSFDLDVCWGDLANIDGELVCIADKRHGGSGFPKNKPDAAQAAQQPRPAKVAQQDPSYPPMPAQKPKDAALEVCIDFAVREAYRGGAKFARLLRIDSVDRKDEGRLRVKGVVLTSEHRDSDETKDMPFRCDSTGGDILEFKWR
jgi:hypothetical protein